MKKLFLTLLKYIFTVLVFLVLVPFTLILGVFGITFSLFSKNLGHYLEKVYFNIILFLTLTRVEVVGLENIRRGKNYVVIANHQSAFDIISLSAKLPLQIRWVSKESVFRIPIVGQFMRVMGYIPVPRGRLKESVRVVKEKARKVGGCPTLFPEGTRSKDGKLQEFKRGFVVIAEITGLDVLPVVITGTREIMEKGSLAITPLRKVRIEILPPISNDEVVRDDNIVDKVRKIYLDRLENYRKI